MIAAVPLIVKDVEIFERSMPSKRISISERFEIDTPTLPTSGLRHRIIGIVTALCGQIQSDRKSRLSLIEQKPVAGVGVLGSTEAGVLPDRPQTSAEAVRKNSAGERELRRLAGVWLAHHVGCRQQRDIDARGRSRRGWRNDELVVNR